MPGLSTWFERKWEYRLHIEVERVEETRGIYYSDFPEGGGGGEVVDVYSLGFRRGSVVQGVTGSGFFCIITVWNLNVVGNLRESWMAFDSRKHISSGFYTRAFCRMNFIFASTIFDYEMANYLD